MPLRRAGGGQWLGVGWAPLKGGGTSFPSTASRGGRRVGVPVGGGGGSGYCRGTWGHTDGLRVALHVEEGARVGVNPQQSSVTPQPHLSNRSCNRRRPLLPSRHPNGANRSHRRVPHSPAASSLSQPNGGGGGEGGGRLKACAGWCCRAYGRVRLSRNARGGGGGHVRWLWEGAGRGAGP